MPDVSLMLDLCNILGITVNELLSGERIIMEDYQKRAEENLMELQAKKEKAQGEYHSILKILIVTFSSFFVLNMVLKNYPLYCPKCKQKTLIEVKDLQVTVIKEPDV